MSNTDRREDGEGLGGVAAAACEGGGGDAPKTPAMDHPGGDEINEALYQFMHAEFAKDKAPAIADALDRLAGDTGHAVFRHAAAVIRGKKGGRPVINDDAVLRRIVSCPESQRKEAVGKAAARMARPGATKKEIETIARRLRSKLGK